MQILNYFSIFCFSLVFILCSSLQALQLGSFYESESGQTVFRVYAKDVQTVDLLVYDSEKSDGFSRHSMTRGTNGLVNVHGLSDQDFRELSQGVYEVRVKGDLTGRYYSYSVAAPSKYDLEFSSGTKAHFKGSDDIDLFLFHTVYGHLKATSATGYFGENEKLKTRLKKIKNAHGIDFVLRSDEDLSFQDFYVEAMPGGEFPKRVNSFPVTDPYCRQFSNYRNRCQVVKALDGNGNRTIGFKAGHVIHEVHVKDLTYLLDGIPDEIRGTYAALAHPETLKKLKDLQVTTIEFLPIHQFDVSAAPPGHINYWGYMTIGFFAPHNAYAHRQQQVREEFRNAVDALHSIGISVVLDVVYNHTSEGDHRGPLVAYKNLARDEYYRMHDATKGFYLNTTGVGNTSKSRSPVMRQLILDSLKLWQEEYGIDGFRFDLGAAIDIETFALVRKNLHPDTLLTAEPWVAAGSAEWQRGDLNPEKVGKWNDAYRQAVKGGHGKAGFINGQNNAHDMKVLVRGEHRNFGGSGSFVHASPGNTNPHGIINEVEVHDGHTLNDWLDKYKTSEEDKLKRIRLAHTLLMTSVNTPILHLGQEFARTKGGNHNSYDQDSAVNWIDWKRQKKYKALNDFTNQLKHLRKHYDAFHFNERIQDSRLIFLDSKEKNQKSFAYQLQGSKYKFLVLINGATDSGANFHFGSEVWTVISDGKRVSNRGLGKVTNGHYFLHPSETAILRSPPME